MIITKKLVSAYMGKNETRFFAGSTFVGSVHHVEGWYLPMVRKAGGISSFGKAMKTMDAAKAWIQITIRNGKTK